MTHKEFFDMMQQAQVIPTEWQRKMVEQMERDFADRNQVRAIIDPATNKRYHQPLNSTYLGQARFTVVSVSPI